MADERKTCFIIMPITTPESYLNQYRDGTKHFKHVLECLFIPAVEKAGYEAIQPIAKGSDIIHAGIIKNIEQSDMVLCDMSCLNPNVFFEFGIRTALNKPICIVRDGLLMDVPFDTGILNHHTYLETLDSWEIDGEVADLATHLRESEDGSNGENTLWKVFGFRSKAEPYTGGTGPDAKIDYLTMQIDALSKQMDARQFNVPLVPRPPIESPRMRRIIESEMESIIPRHMIDTLLFTSSGLELHVNESVPRRVRLGLKELIEAKYGMTLKFVHMTAGDPANYQEIDEDYTDGQG